MVGLFERKDHRPAELSGGEQQRVAIARALINRPNILLADEPTGNLDSKTSGQIVQTLSDLNKNRGLTVVMISHEESLLAQYADDVVHLCDGKIVEQEISN
jgi:ABC-type lipoprotein export system ATPase subunit